MILCQVAFGEFEPDITIQALADTEFWQLDILSHCTNRFADPTPTPDHRPDTSTAPTIPPPPPTATPTATATPEPTPTPIPTATATAIPTPTPTPSPLDQAVALADQIREALAESESLEALTELAGVAGEHALVILCQISDGEFEPDLTLSDLTDSRTLRIGIRGFCANQ